MKGRSSAEQFLIHRLAGYIEGQIAVFSATHNIPSVVLTQRVAELLSNPTGRSSEEDYVQPVREGSAFGTQGRRTLEVGGHPQNSLPRGTAKRRGPGRPKGVKNKQPLRSHSLTATNKPVVKKRGGHIMSAEARKRVAEAQRNRWARAREQAEKTGQKVTPQTLHQFISPVQESQEVTLSNVS